MSRKLFRNIVMILSNKARFIKEQCDDIIDLRKKKKAVVIEMLKTRNYDVVDEDEDYKYLTKMPIDSVLEENVEKLMKERDAKMSELDILKNTTIEKMWTRELNALSIKYMKYRKDRESRLLGEVRKTKKMKAKNSKVTKK